VHYPLASPIHGGGGPRKRWKGLASGDNASYSFLHHSGGPPLVAAPPPLPRWEACHWILSRLTAPYESSSLATPLFRGTMDAGHFGQFACGAAAKGKPYNRASPVGNAPFGACGTKGGRSHRRWLLSADWYLLPFVSNAACTEILRWCGDPAEGLQVSRSWPCVG
jgi:hypothetical protein